MALQRVIVNQAKAHYNKALELAERGRSEDAAAELYRALELQSAFPEVYLLLGTLAARDGQTEEARRAWRKAMEYDSTSKRAHAYLEDLGPKTPFEADRARLHLIVTGGVVLALIFLVLAIVFGGPTRQDVMLRDAYREYARGNLAESLSVLDELPRREAPEAESLAVTVRATLRGRLTAIREALAAGETARAVELGRSLAAMNPPEDAALELAAMLALARDRELRELRSIVGGPLDAGTAGRFAVQKDVVLDHFPGELAAVRVAEEELAARAAEAQQAALAEARVALDSARPAFEVRDALDRAGALVEVSGVTPSGLGALQRLLAAREARSQLDQAREARARGDSLRAARLLSAVETRLLEPETAAEVRALSAELKNEQLAATLDAAEAAMAEERFEEAAAALEEAAALDFAEEDGRRIEALRADVSRRLGLAALYRLLRQGEAFDTATLTREEARAALADVERARGELPESQLASYRDDLAFFDAVARWVLGDERAAWAQIEDLRAQQPKSPYLATWRIITTPRAETPKAPTP
ncbi:MAG: hypothetical protein RLY93_09680 [Sumerlaeia bacterium]